MRRWRIALGTAGILLGLFGVFRLVTQIPLADDVVLALWLIAAVIIHDGVLTPIVLAVGWAVARVVPARGRRYLQAALIAGVPATVIAIPMIYRRGSQPKSKAILQQNYFGNLTLLLAIIASLSLLAYAIHVAGDHRRGRSRSSVSPRSADDPRPDRPAP